MEDLGLIPGLGRSPGEEKGDLLQYSGLKNSMDCIVHGVTKSDVTKQISLQFSNQQFLQIFYLLTLEVRNNHENLV